MDFEKPDMVVVECDVERSLVMCDVYFSEKTTNKIKLMYGYNTPRAVNWNWRFDEMVGFIRVIEKRFHVYSTKKSCVFILPYRHYINFYSYAYLSGHVKTTETDFDKKLKIFKVAASNFKSENDVISMYCRNDNHSMA